MYSELRVLLECLGMSTSLREARISGDQGLPVREQERRCRFHAPVLTRAAASRDVVPLLRVSSRLIFEYQMQWAYRRRRQSCMSGRKAAFSTPSFRLDNIVLSSKWDAVMVDFEQRGVWCEFAAPEVNAVDYIRILATDYPQTDDDAESANPTRERYTLPC